MSKHRRTKSNGNYFTPSIMENLIEEEHCQDNETQAIIQQIQSSGEHQKQIVEKLEESQQGMYNSMFNFGKGQSKQNHDPNMSVISECSSTPSSEQPQIKMKYHRKCGSQFTPIQKGRVHAHSQSLQLTIQYLEQEIEQLKVQQMEMQNINKFLIREIHQSRQDYIMSQQKNEAILKRVEQLERMLQLQLNQQDTLECINFPN